MDENVWVPLVTAGIGFAAGVFTSLASTLVTQRRDDKVRKQQWQREDAQRWHKDRQQTYARFLSALHEWDAVLATAVNQFQVNVQSRAQIAIDMSALTDACNAAVAQFPLVQFMASKGTRDLATDALRRREEFWVTRLARTEETLRLKLIDPIVPSQAERDKAWGKILMSKRSVVEAMRDDLGLEIAIEDTDTASLNEVQAMVAEREQANQPPTGPSPS